jgi:hypothetical protein
MQGNEFGSEKGTCADESDFVCGYEYAIPAYCPDWTHESNVKTILPLLLL